MKKLLRHRDHAMAPEQIAQLNLDLARAIGWSDADPEDPDVVTYIPVFAPPWVGVWFAGKWRTFDFRDWDTIAPIAARYDCFPHLVNFSKWSTKLREVEEETPALAIALTVLYLHRAGVA